MDLLPIPIRIPAGSRDAQRLLPSEIDGQGLEPRRVDKEGRLAGYGIQADHVPEEPGLHGACVAVAWEAGFAGAVVFFGDAAGARGGEVWAVDVVVEVGDVEHPVIIRDGSEEMESMDTLTVHL